MSKEAELPENDRSGTEQEPLIHGMTMSGPETVRG